MLWILFHKLFGWHYVLIPYGHTNEVRKVRNLNGKLLIKLYGEVLVLNRDGTVENYYKKYTPLTWDLDKE